MKSIAHLGMAILSLFAYANLAFSATPGSYLGAGLGKTQLSTPDEYLFNVNGGANGTTSKKRDGMGGRAFAGYNFNEYLGIEAGVTHYAKSKYSASLNHSTSSLEYSMNAIDLVAKTYLPFGDKRFNVYALGGMAAVNHDVQYKNGGIPFVSDFIAPGHGTKSKPKIRPIYGVGVGYDIPKSRFTASMELTRIQGLGDVTTNNNAMPPANMVAFSLTYNFGS